MVISENMTLGPFTTFRIGGPARFFCRVKNLGELKFAVSFAKEKNLPIFVLGGGSNILVSDSGFKGLVIKNELEGIEELNNENNSIIIAGAGENWDNFVKYTVEKQLCGLENLSGIPGTVGATPVQNIGAYGSEVGDNIFWVEVFDIEDEKIKILQKNECEFGYRKSIFKKPLGRKFVITRVAYSLKNNGKTNVGYKDIKVYMKNLGKKSLSLEEVREAVLKIRKSKMPDLSLNGTAGSFFKNPIIPKSEYESLKIKYPELPFYASGEESVKIPLAWVLDNVCGLKGFKKGEVGLYEKQPIVLVNFGKANALQVSDFAKEITLKVKEKTGIDVEWEVERI